MQTSKKQQQLELPQCKVTERVKTHKNGKFIYVCH